MSEETTKYMYGVKIKGRNGYFHLDRYKVVVGRTKCAIYFFSGRQGKSAPSQIVGDSEAIVKLLEEIKVEMVRQKMTGKHKNYNPGIGG